MAHRYALFYTGTPFWKACTYLSTTTFRDRSFKIQHFLNISISLAARTAIPASPLIAVNVADAPDEGRETSQQLKLHAW